MWSTSIPANYKKTSQHVVSVSSTVETAMPTPDSTKIGKPERVMLQSWTKNTKSIFVGKTGVLSDGTTGGYEYPPGSIGFLSGKDYANWKMLADTTTGQKMFVTYLAEVD